MSQYIGKTISLISNKGLRYVGLLDNINADDATVALKSVRSLGTEGRLAQTGMPNLEVMAGNDVYDYVVFRGSDVKDLTVLDIPVDQVKPEPYVPTPAPTAAYYQQPIETTSQQQSQPQTAAPSQAEAHQAAKPTQPLPRETAAPQTAQPQPQPQPTPTQPAYATPSQEQKNAQPQKSPEAIDKSTDRKEDDLSDAKPVSRPQKNTGPAVPEEAFDFESANAKFAREALQEKENSGASYDKKSSFFDTISSSNEERGSMRWSEEKSLNMDTFGESSIGGRGRGRGRGRGGWRGRGNGRRGRGRGNFKNSTPEWA